MTLKISNEHCKHGCHLMFIRCLMMECILIVGPLHELDLGMCLRLFTHE